MRRRGGVRFPALAGSAILAASLLGGCTTLVENDGELAPAPSADGAAATPDPSPRETATAKPRPAIRALSIPATGPAERSLISLGSWDGMVEQEQLLASSATLKKGELLIQVDCVGADGELSVDILNVGLFAMDCLLGAPLIHQMGGLPGGTDLATRIVVPAGAQWRVAVLEADNPLRAESED